LEDDAPNQLNSLFGEAKSSIWCS